MECGFESRRPHHGFCAGVYRDAGGCDRRPDSGPVVASAIGTAPRLADPSRTLPNTPTRLLLDATAEGLVRFDASGQIEPGLAERWIVIDQGTSYIFRLRDAQWPDGSAVTADQSSRSCGARSPPARATPSPRS